jgi:DNA-binding response OmpR family regulator
VRKLHEIMNIRGSSRKLILIADDDGEFLCELEQGLDAFGYDTVSFSGSDAVLRSAGALRPDAIMLDLRMGDITGFQVANRLSFSRRTAGIPIIGMTGFYTDREHAVLMDICGIHSCLLKPFSAERAAAEIEAVLVAKIRRPSQS